jgi:hypothetical protein
MTLVGGRYALQDHLRDDYLDKRRRLFSSDYVDTVTVGQAGLLVELKLANDNLRWRLQQKQLANRAQKAIIVDLQVYMHAPLSQTALRHLPPALLVPFTSNSSFSSPLLSSCRSVSSRPRRVSRISTRPVMPPCS